MRVRDWQDIVSDVIEERADPDDWRAVAGNRAEGLGEDLYLGHPAAGVFQLKTYAKNPFEVKGVGTKVARRVDEDLEPLFPDANTSSRFAVQQPPEDQDDATQKANNLQEVLKAHADAPTTPGDLFEDVMEVLDSPAFGPMEYEPTDRPDVLDEFASTFEDAEEILDAELDDLVEKDEVGRGFQ